MQILLFILLSSVPEWDLTTSLSYVYGASPAQAGGVWCASSGGVFRYSGPGEYGEVFSCPEDLPIPDIRDVLEDSAGRMWFATGGEGLVLLDGQNWSSFSTFEGIPGDGTVTSLIEAAGDIWVGCRGGFSHGGPSGFTPVGEALPATDVYSIAARNDTLWLCTEKGIFSLNDPYNPLNPSSWRYWAETRNYELDKVRAGETSIYACGMSGAVQLEAGADRFELIIDYTSQADSAVIDMIEFDSSLYAAIRGSVIVKNGESWEETGIWLPSSRWPVSLFTLNGVLYTSFTYQTKVTDLVNTQAGMGLYRLQNGQWLLETIPGIQCKRVHQMACLEDGRVYVATYLRGVQAYYPDYGWRSYTQSHGMPNGFQVFSVAAGFGQGVWASSYHHGLSWIRDNEDWSEQGDTILTFVRDTLESHSPGATLIQADIPNNQPVMITGQANGLWAAFRQFDPAGQPDEPSGITGFNGDPMGTMNWGSRTGGSGIAGINVRSVYPVSQDSLWIALENGGCQLLVHSGNPADTSEDQWYPGFGQAYTSSSGLPSNDVYCFLKVPGIGLLAGTGNGLARWTGSGFTDYQSISETVKAINTDTAGRIWCLGQSAIYRISDGQLSSFNHINSDYIPSTLYTWEYAARNPITGGVVFSSIEGLWSVEQSGGGGGGFSGVSFYPQPYVFGGEPLRFISSIEASPVSVDFFRLNGSFIGRVEAPTVADWTWDGTLNGKIVASGIYMLLITTGQEVHRSKISVVR